MDEPEEETTEEWYARTYPRYARERELYEEYVASVGGYLNSTFSFTASREYVAERMKNYV